MPPPSPPRPCPLFTTALIFLLRSTIQPGPQQHHASALTSITIAKTKKIQTAQFGTREDDYFVNSLLSEDDSSPSRCTHMIAIPLEANHDLLLELESVQRAILYHCPLLIDAVVSPSITRMPLLYVDTAGKGEEGTFTGFDANSKMSVFGGSRDDLLTSRDPVTQTLHGIVEDVARERLFSAEAETETEAETEGEETREGVNSQNVRPVLLRFQGLEIDGDDNSVLHAVGAPGCSGADVLREVVGEIARRIEGLGKGWRVYLPLDRPQMRMDGSGVGAGEEGVGEDGWRPRVPFMRLPHDFFETLPDPKGMDGQWQNYSEEDKKNYIRFPEEGGNGISPIFWYKWWEDSFCEGKGVRMQELAVYGRTGPFGTTERAFYVPHLKSPLPRGNSILTRDEIRGREYDASRRLEQEQMAEREEKEGVSSSSFTPSTQTLDDDLRRKQSGADRRMLQTIFDSSPDFEVGIGEIDEKQRKDNDKDDGKTDGSKTKKTKTVDRIPAKAPVVSDSDEFALKAARAAAAARKKDFSVVDDNDIDIPSEDTIIDASTTASTDDVPSLYDDDKDNDDDERRSDKAADIIGSIAKPIATGDWSKLPRRNKGKDIPSPEDNPIFQQFRKYGTVTTPSGTVGSIGRPRETRNQKRKPPFPSDEYFVGIWRLQSTPNGPSIDERRLMGLTSEEDDPSKSENLILRADGRIAGGPVLDVVNNQRAAGGIWRFFQAEWIGDDKDLDGASGEAQEMGRRISTRLKVRLVIPPKKDRVLVMEGEVKRGPISTPTGTSEANLRDMRSRTSSFSTMAGNKGGRGLGEGGETVIPPTAGGGGGDSEEEETVLHCTGEVWVEDATGEGKKNRSFLGKFSLLKLKERNPNEYVYTIPAPRKIQD